MDHDKFITIVREQGGLPDGARAEACAQTALETLGARLNGGTADALAAHLPEPEAAALRRRIGTSGDEGASGGMEDLATTFGGRAGLDTIEAASVLQATIRAVTEAVEDREQLERVRAQLPPDLATLFGSTEERSDSYRSASGG